MPSPNDNVQPGVAFPISPTSSSVLSDEIESSFINILWNNVFYYRTIFEAISPVYVSCNAGTGASCPSTGIGAGLAVNTEGSTSGNYGDVDVRTANDAGLTWNADARMRLNVSVGANTSQTCYLIHGSQNIVSPYYGFKIVNGNLYGLFYAGTGSERTVLLQAISANTQYLVEAQYSYANAIKFLVNKQYAGLLRVSDAPISPSASKIGLYNFRITTNTSTPPGRGMTIGFFEYIQNK